MTTKTGAERQRGRKLEREIKTDKQGDGKERCRVWRSRLYLTDNSS